MCEVLSQQSYDEEKCIVCGHVVRFYENEYKKPCGYCGTWVFEKRKQVQQQEQDKKEPKCWICMDRGIVEYPVQQGMGVYTYVARCTCPKGLNWPSTIPLLDQCTYAPRSEFIELRNRELLGMVWAYERE
jgi:hypothetical protein